MDGRLRGLEGGGGDDILKGLSGYVKTDQGTILCNVIIKESVAYNNVESERRSAS